MRSWIGQIDAITKNFGGAKREGRELIALCDVVLNRTRTNATKPSFLSDPRLSLTSMSFNASGGETLRSEDRSRTETANSTGGGEEDELLPDPMVPGGPLSGAAPSVTTEAEGDMSHIRTYADLSPEAQHLDLMLFNSLYNICQGSIQKLLQDLTGEYARYTFGIISLWMHSDLSASSRRLEALSEMQGLKYELGRCRQVEAGLSR